MAITERLSLIIDADGKGAIRELNKVGQSAEREIGRADNKLDKFGATMTSTGTKMMAGAAVIGAGMWQAGMAAADLEQAVGGTEAVFGEFTGTIETFAEGAAAAAGLSERSARELTSTIGAILQGFGYTQEEAAATSVSLAQLGADLSATFGGTPEEAVQALGAALRGEFDPLERFGVSLTADKIALEAVSMGLAKTKTDVDAHAKSQAALSLIMQQSANAQGQFGRETETAAGRMAIAKAEFENATAQLGEGMLPVMTKVIGMGAGMVDTFTSIDSATGGMASTIAGAAAPVLGLGGALAFGVGKAIEMRDSIKEMTANGSKIAGWAGAAAVGVTGLAVAYELWAGAMEEAAKKGATVLEGIKADAADDSPEELAAKIEEIGVQIEGLNDAQNNSIAPWDADKRQQMREFNRELGNTQVSLVKVLNQSAELTTATGDSQSVTLDWIRTEEAAGRTYDNTAALLAAYTGEIDHSALSQADAKKATEAQTAATDDGGKAIEEARKELDKYVKAIDDYYDLIDSSTDQTMAWEAAIDQQAATLAENGLQWDWVRGRIDLTTEAGRNVMEGYQAQRDVIINESQALLQNGASSAVAAARANELTGQLRQQMLEAGYTEAQVNTLISTLGLMPEQVHTIISADTAEAERRIQAVIDRLLAVQSVGGAAVSVGAAVGNIFGGGRAAGGPISAGSSYLVGEQGPELVVAGQNATVIPAEQTARMMGGGGSDRPIEVVMNVDGREFYRKIVKPNMQADIQGNNGFGGR